MTPRAILLMGPPGAGKGTQVEGLIERFADFRNFDTGQAIERIVHNPKNQDDPVIRSERKLFETGILNTPSWTIGVLKDGVARIAASGFGVILSGSPRTREEADVLIPHLFDLYGEGSIVVITLRVSKETSIFRNSHRRVCKSCGRPLLWSAENEKLTYCPPCGGELVGRVLDKPDIIVERLKEYQNRTEKIFPLFQALGIPILEINGEGAPEEVAHNIARALENLISHDNQK